MRHRTRLAAVSLALAATVPLLVPAPALAATGQVVVFQTEFQPLEIYTDPSGCTRLPLAAHVLDNLTDQVVRVYGDPFCLTPSMTVQPGYGAHVPPMSGSFSVD